MEHIVFRMEHIVFRMEHIVFRMEHIVFRIEHIVLSGEHIVLPGEHRDISFKNYDKQRFYPGKRAYIPVEGRRKCFVLIAILKRDNRRLMLTLSIQGKTQEKTKVR
jgi:hypothetical protein